MKTKEKEKQEKVKNLTESILTIADRFTNDETIQISALTSSMMLLGIKMYGYDEFKKILTEGLELTEPHAREMEKEKVKK